MKSLLLTMLLLLTPGLALSGDFPVADLVIIEKAARKLHLLQDGYRDERPPRYSTLTMKQEGDFRTPEGRYLLDSRNPNSDYFLSIHISYPNALDRSEAQELGVEPGGAIMIHGQPNVPTRSEVYYRTQDWTNGCIAVSNSDMIDIWLMTGDETPIEIRP